MIVNDCSVEATEGKTIIRDSEYVFICPICEEEISYGIDDFDTAYYCPECNNAVVFPEKQIEENVL